MSPVDDTKTAVVARENQVALWPAAKPVPHGWTVATVAATEAEAAAWIESRVSPTELAARLSQLPEVTGTRVFRSQVAVAITADAIEKLSSFEETLEAWEMVFSDLYDEDAGETVGWVDSVTGRAYTKHEMADWVQATQRRVETLPRNRVVEIGCGTGMIAQAVLATGETSEYVATDLIDVSARAKDWETHGARVRMIQAPAHDAVEMAAADGPADLTILHSVTQYFPHTEYAANVLRAAVDATSPGGHVYIGDIRHLAFDDTLRRQRARMHGADSAVDATTGPDAMELGFRPSWFERLAARIPGVARVDVVPRLGSGDTEMTRYRFDALLHVGCDATVDMPTVKEIPRLDRTEWSSMLDRGEALRVLLPNGLHHPDGLSPQELVSVAQEFGNGHLSLRFCNDDEDSYLDTLWRPGTDEGCAWGHPRLHEEWRPTAAFASRNHHDARTALLENAELTTDDLDPAIRIVLTDSGDDR